MPRLAESLLQCLVAHQVDTVFGIPGNHNVELYRDLPNQPLTHITARHEQGAAFMADGYARASGRPGVCWLISGPGVGNAATALGQALADSIPVVVLATVAEVEPYQRSGALHELPSQLALAESVCLQAVAPQRPEDVLPALQRALTAHLAERPGPRYIQIPISWLTQEVTPPLPVPTPTPPQPAAEDLSRAVALIEEAQRPLLLLGGGSVGAGAELTQLAQRLGAPVVNTVNAKGVVAPQHRLAIGGSPSLTNVREWVDRADLLIAVGTEFGETDYDLLMTQPFTLRAPLIRIDIDPQQLLLNATPTVGLCGDAKMVCVDLLNELDAADRVSWYADQQTSESATHFHPDFRHLFDVLESSCPNAVVVGDSTRPTYYASWMFERSMPRRYFHSVSGFGTLGYALPAALGAQLAVPEQTVIGLIGDGGVLFTLGELAVAAAYQIPVKLIIWDNSGYQEIAHSMQARQIDGQSTQYQSPDFLTIARGFGIQASQPRDWQALAQALQQSVSGPHLLVLSEEDFVHSPSGDWY